NESQRIVGIEVLCMTTMPFLRNRRRRKNPTAVPRKPRNQLVMTAREHVRFNVELDNHVGRIKDIEKSECICVAGRLCRSSFLHGGVKSGRVQDSRVNDTLFQKILRPFVEPIDEYSSVQRG